MSSYIIIKDKDEDKLINKLINEKIDTYTEKYYNELCNYVDNILISKNVEKKELLSQKNMEENKLKNYGIMDINKKKEINKNVENINKKYDDINNFYISYEEFNSKLINYYTKTRSETINKELRQIIKEIDYETYEKSSKIEKYMVYVKILGIKFKNIDENFIILQKKIEDEIKINKENLENLKDISNYEIIERSEIKITYDKYNKKFIFNKYMFSLYNIIENIDKKYDSNIIIETYYKNSLYDSDEYNHNYCDRKLMLLCKFQELINLEY